MPDPLLPRPGPLSVARLGATDFAGLGFSAVGLVWSAVAVLALAPRFALMFADFGKPSALPAFTQLYLSAWFPFALALTPLAVVLAGIAIDAPRSLRLVLALVAGVLTLALPATFFVAMYLPIFSLADKVR